ncbi:MAG: trypsin-like peptidase domain-containing protein [Porticoccus sp.]
MLTACWPYEFRGLKSIFPLLIAIVLSSCQTTGIEERGFTKPALENEASSLAKEISETKKPPSQPITPREIASQNAKDGSSSQTAESKSTTGSSSSPDDSSPAKPKGEEASSNPLSPEKNDASPAPKDDPKTKPTSKKQPEDTGPKSINPPMIFGDKPKEPKIAPPTKNGLATGTGFFISTDGYLLTNEHLIADAKELKVFVGDISYDAHVVSLNRKDDIAILKIELETKPLSLKTSEPLAGTEVSVLGFPNIGLQGNEIKATFGHVNAASGIQGDKRYLQFSAEIQPGNSGSPVIDEGGYVIGVATSTLNQEVAVAQTGTLAQGVNYALKANHAEKLITNTRLEILEQTNTTGSMSRVELIQQVKESVVLIVAAIGQGATIPKTKPRAPKTSPEMQPEGAGNGGPKQLTPQPKFIPNSSTSKEPTNSGGGAGDGNSVSSSNEEVGEEQKPSGNTFHYIHFDRE